MIALACILWALGFVCLWSIVAVGARSEPREVREWLEAEAAELEFPGRE